MTEAEWLAAKDPMQMLRHLDPDPLARKSLLVTAAACRRLWPLLPSCCREWVEKVETVAEGQEDPQRLDDDWESVEGFLAGNKYEPLGDGPCYAALLIATASWKSDGVVAGNERWAAEQAAEADLIRDVFGNPYQPVSADTARIAPSVVHLAQTIYDEKAFKRMSQLADVLEEARYTATDISAHCRGPESHVRGCWVIDLLLGRD